MLKQLWNWIVSLFKSAPAPVQPAPIKPLPVQPVSSVLKKGDKGDAVTTLQNRLIFLNYLDGLADGNFDDKTESAVQTFQATMGLKADGIVGPLTRAALVTAKPIPDTPVPVPSGNRVRGIDTSHYEPGVNWMEVAKECPFSITKTTEGLTGVDSLFSKYWAGMKAAGMVRGAYHFFHPDEDPIAQAKHFLAVVGKFDDGDLPAILDFEAHGGLSNGAQATAALKWLDYVQAITGKVPIIYASPSFIIEMGSPAAFAKYPLWIANYGVSKPHIPKPWTAWTIWQDTDKGRIAGVPQGVDMNWFNGSTAELKAFASKRA